MIIKPQKIKFTLMFISILSIGFIIGCKSNETKRSEELEYSNPPAHKFYSIKKFVDGDTFWIDNGTPKGEKIRLIGVDAPESKNYFKIKKEYFGKEAADYVKKLLTNKKVRLEYDVDKTDRYNRTLAYVYLEDGTFLNAKLVKEGYAVVMTIPPNVKHVDTFIKMQKYARENKKGLWKPVN